MESVTNNGTIYQHIHKEQKILTVSVSGMYFIEGIGSIYLEKGETVNIKETK